MSRCDFENYQISVGVAGDDIMSHILVASCARWVRNDQVRVSNIRYEHKSPLYTVKSLI